MACQEHVYMICACSILVDLATLHHQDWTWDRLADTDTWLDHSNTLMQSSMKSDSPPGLPAVLCL